MRRSNTPQVEGLVSMMPAVFGPTAALQRLDVHVAFVVDGNFLHHAAAHGGRGGIGAVRRDRHDDFVAGEIAARAVIGADHGHAGEFAMRAGHGRERHALHAGDFLEHLLQLEHAGEETLAQRIRRQRMPVEEPGSIANGVTGLRVVLHRARSQRIEVRVDGEVELRELGEVAHHFELADFRQHRPASCGEGSPECRRRSRSACRGPSATGRTHRDRDASIRR